MSWFGNPFGGKKEGPGGGGETHSVGAPLVYTCALCGQALHGGTGQTLMGGPELLGHLLKRAKRCPNCGKVFCAKCSIETDKKLGEPAGAVDYTCPFCRTTGIPG